MKKFPYVAMEVVERSEYEGGTYFLIQTVEDRNGWEVADVRPDIPWQLKTAKLLAAAPDLLEALEYIMREDGDNYRLDHHAYEIARAAIARARGEE